MNAIQPAVASRRGAQGAGAALKGMLFRNHSSQQ
jgi:hypothetical protein